MSKVPVRDILLDDSNQINNNGYSPMQHNQQLAKNYLLSKSLQTISGLGLIGSAYFAYKKTYTKRWVYKGAVLLNIIGFYCLNELRVSNSKQCLDSFNCKIEDLNEYAKFYSNAILDKDNFYEVEKKPKA